MRRQLLAAATLLAALSWCIPDSTASGAPPAVPERVFKCAECGMSAKVANRFSAQIVQGADTLYFCDIGDLVAFIERTHPKEYAASVNDFKSGEWIDVKKAFFVVDKKVFSTPMGWGVAAFQDKASAIGAPLGFEALRKALK